MSHVTGPRLLVVTPQSPLNMGGVEKVVREVNTRLAGRGVPVEILCTDPNASAVADFDMDGVPVRAVPARPRGKDWLWAPSLWGEIAQRRPDILHLHSYHTFVAPLTMMRARDLRVPYVMTFHGGGSSSGLRNSARVTQRRLQRRLYARAERLVAVARFEVDQYGAELKLGADHFTVIPNGVALPPEITAAATPSAGVAADAPVTIATIGRLELYKGHHRVIAAMPELLRRRPGARLLVVGAGPDEAELRQRAADSGVADNIEFTVVPAGDSGGMARLLTSVDLVALMSEFESHPLVAIEAATARRRLVVADIAGLGELAADGFGRPVGIGIPGPDLAAVIDAELSAPSPTEAPHVFTWDECADAHLSLYREILG